MKAQLLRLLISLILFSTLQESAFANVVSVDTQNFNPTSSGIDFVTVESSETLDPGILNMGLFLNVAQNTLPRLYDNNSQSNKKFRDRLTSSDLNFGLGLLKNWDIGLNLPAVVSQQFQDDNSRLSGSFAEPGFNEIRLMTKYQLSGGDHGGTAVSYTLSKNLIRDNPFVGKNPSPISTFQFIADTSFNNLAMGLNLGYRMRFNDGALVTNPLIEPIKNQYIASIATSYLFQSIDTKIISEIFTSFPAESYQRTGDRDNSSAEFLLGLKHDIRHDLAVHFGGGTELSHGTASPEWRVYTGISWAVGPLWNENKRDQEKERLAQERRRMRLEAERLAKANEAAAAAYVPQGPPPIPSDFGTAVKDSGPGQVYVLRDITFPLNSAIPTDESQEVINDLADYLLTRKSGFKSIVIEGHTDSTGESDYNQMLSEKRAQYMKDQIIRRYDIDTKKINAFCYGETRPLRSNDNYQGRQANRRVQVRIE